MRRILMLLFVLGLSLLTACQASHNTPNDEQVKNELSEEELYDIYLLFKTPKADEKKDFDDVIKIVLTENDSSKEKTIAIELNEGTVHADPFISSSGILSTEVFKDVADLDKFIALLKEFEVETWKEDYSFESPEDYEDGYGWSLWLQYEDGSTNKYHGSGSFKDEVTPDDFQDFLDAIYHLHDDLVEGLEKKTI